MLHPVLKKKLFDDLQIPIETRGYYGEFGIDTHLMDTLIKREARWLSMNRAGALVGFDPEEDIYVGARLVLNKNGVVHPDDIISVLVTGTPEMSTDELQIKAYTDVINQAVKTHTWASSNSGQYGWVVDKTPEGIIIQRNYVNFVSHVSRTSVQ